MSCCFIHWKCHAGELNSRNTDLRNGTETWILVHIEIQSQAESLFPQRMFVYNYRSFDRYKRVVVSLAILGDERSTWRPDQFGYQLWGCQVGFQFSYC
jgi:hypothetical protein